MRVSYSDNLRHQKAVLELKKQGHVKRCLVCLKEGNRRNMMRHVIREHVPKKERPNRCRACGAGHYTESDLKQHIRGSHKEAEVADLVAEKVSLPNWEEYLSDFSREESLKFYEELFALPSLEDHQPATEEVADKPAIDDDASRPDVPAKARKPAASTKGESGDVEARRPDVSEKASRPDVPAKTRKPAASTKGESGDVEARRSDVSEKVSRPDVSAKARKPAASANGKDSDVEARRPDIPEKASRPDVPTKTRKPAASTKGESGNDEARRPEVSAKASRPDVPAKARETEDVEWSCSSSGGQSDAPPPPEEHCPPIRLTINKRRFHSPEIELHAPPTESMEDVLVESPVPEKRARGGDCPTCGDSLEERISAAMVSALNKWDAAHRQEIQDLKKEVDELKSTMTSRRAESPLNRRDERYASHRRRSISPDRGMGRQFQQLRDQLKKSSKK